jgi:hypothetical protein
LQLSAFVLCRRSPSFTLPSTIVSLCLAVDDRHRQTGVQAGRQAGPLVAKLKRIISDFSEASGRWAWPRAHLFSEGSGGARRGGQEVGHICSTKKNILFQSRVGQTDGQQGGQMRGPICSQRKAHYFSAGTLRAGGPIGGQKYLISVKRSVLKGLEI